MDREENCRHCGKVFERSEDSDWGGKETCPHCGAVHDFSFDTGFGLHVDGVKIGKVS